MASGGVRSSEQEPGAGSPDRQLTPRRREARQGLRCIAGHLRGIGGMLSAGTDWAESVDQIRAVRRALTRVALLLLEEHIETLAASSRDAWDSETMDRAVHDTCDALLGGPAAEDGERGEAFPFGLGQEGGCPSV